MVKWTETDYLLHQHRTRTPEQKQKAQEVNDFKYEKKLQNQISDWLNLQGIIFWRQRMDRKSNVAVGLPDFFFSYYGTAVAWEVKRPQGQPTKEQLETIIKLQQTPNNCQVRVVRSLEECQAHLKEIKISETH